MTLRVHPRSSFRSFPVVPCAPPTQSRTMEGSITAIEQRTADHLLISVFISWGCCEKVPHTGWPKQQKLSSHSSGSCRSEITVLAGLVSSEGCEGEPAPCLCSRPQGSAGHLWHSLAHRSATQSRSLCSHGMFSLCSWLCQNFPFSKDTSPTGLKAHPNPLS